MKQSFTHHISSCTIIWICGDSPCTEGPAKVITRILQTEVQVRFYNESDELLGGRLWPMSDQQRKMLYGHLELCHHEWNQDVAANAVDKPHWQMKICTKGKCLKTMEGTGEPLFGAVIKDILQQIVGHSDCYFY